MASLLIGLSMGRVATANDDNFTFGEAVGLYSGYYYNPIAGYVGPNGNVLKGRQIIEHPTEEGKFKYVPSPEYDALTCSGFVVPVLCRYLYGRSGWQSKLRQRYLDYQQGGATIASNFGLRLSANLTPAEIMSPSSINTLITQGTLHAGSYYFFTVSTAGGGHVGFIQVKAGGILETYQYSDMNVRGLTNRLDYTDETYNMNIYSVSNGVLMERVGGETRAVSPVPVRPPGGFLPLTMAHRTSRLGYHAGPLTAWYQGSRYSRSTMQLYELTPPLQSRVIYTWSSQSRDLDIGVTFLGSSMGWSHTNNSPYMTWTGDDTGYAGSETVTIDLQQALDDGQIQVDNPVTVNLAAGWYSPAGGSGPATVRAQLLRQDTVLSDAQRVIAPGSQSTRCTYQVGNLTINVGARTMELQ